MKHLYRFLVFSLLFLTAFKAAHASKEKPVNLLNLKETSLVEVSLPSARAHVSSLIDEDPKTIASFTIPSENSVDIVFSFQGAIVSPEKVSITLPPPQKGSPKLRGTVEILVSNLSPNAGFQSVQIVHLKNKKGVQHFPFPPIAAKWIMLRLTPPPSAEEISIADLTISGHLGAPETKYLFKESPADAFAVIAQLQKTVDIDIHPDEADLFADAKDKTLDKWSFAEAALLASGVQKSADRERYLKKIDHLEKGAREAISQGKTVFEKGDLLLKWLHKNAMKNGYKLGQTDLSTLLDTGVYNCVSSAVLYNIISKRLGLDARAIEVPDHAFSIVYEGTQHADVETTTPAGFNPTRDRAVLEEFTKQTGFSYIPQKHKNKRREIGVPGLISIIFYNHGVFLLEEKKYQEALFSYFRALSMDSENASAVKNILVTLTRWSLDLSKEKKYEQSLDIISGGLTLAPQDRTLVHNQKAIWSEWINTEIDANHTERALALVKKAHQAVPDGNFLGMESWVFIKGGETFAKEKQWEKAIAQGKEALKQAHILSPQAQQELKKWQRDLFLRWSNQEIRAKDFAKAAGILDRGLAIYPDETPFTQQLEYTVQEWMRHAYRSDGLENTEKIFRQLIDRYPKQNQVHRALAGYVFYVMEDFHKKDKSQEALRIVKNYSPLIQDGEDKNKLLSVAYDKLASRHRKKQEWAQSIEIYKQGLDELPQNKLLTHNAEVTWNTWALSHINKKEWEKGKEVLQEALQNHPDARNFKQNLRYLTQEWAQEVAQKDSYEKSFTVLESLIVQFPDIRGVREAAEAHVHRAVNALSKEKKYQEALVLAEKSRALFKEERKAKKPIRMIYDEWARSFWEKKEWQQAVTIYQQGIEALQGDSFLQKNAIATWDSWAKTYFDTKEWEEAISIYEAGLEKFPNSWLFKKNIKYCQQELKKMADDQDNAH